VHDGLLLRIIRCRSALVRIRAAVAVLPWRRAVAVALCRSGRIAQLHLYIDRSIIITSLLLGIGNQYTIFAENQIRLNMISLVLTRRRKMYAFIGLNRPSHLIRQRFLGFLFLRICTFLRRIYILLRCIRALLRRIRTLLRRI